MKSSYYILRSRFVLIILLLAGSAKLYAQHIDILGDPVPSFDYEGYMAKWQDSTLTDEVRLEAFFTLLFQHNEYGKGPPPSIYVDVWREDVDKALALESKYNNLEYRYVFESYALIYDLFFVGVDSSAACVRFEELFLMTSQLIDPSPTIDTINLLYQLGPKDCASLYLDVAPKTFDQMRQNLVDENWAQLRINAHSLKPQVDFMGIAELKNVLATIEESCRANKIEGMSEQLGLAIDIFENSTELLEEKLKNLSQ